MKLSKVLSIIVLAVMILAIATNFVYAIDPASIKASTAGSGVSKVQSIGGTILGLVQVVGSVLAVIVLAVIGIKYMMGSTEEKAEYKKTLLPYIIGAVILFAASNLASVVFNMAKNV